MGTKRAKNLTYLAASCLMIVGCVASTPDDEDAPSKEQAGAAGEAASSDAGAAGDGESKGGAAGAAAGTVAGAAGLAAGAGGASAGAGGATAETAGAAAEAGGATAEAGGATAEAGGATAETAGAAAEAGGATAEAGGATAQAGGTSAGAGGASAGAGGASAGAGGAVDVAVSELAQIEGASFTEGGRPDTTDSSTAPGVEAPSDVINGGTATYSVTVGSTASVILVGIEGDNGYFSVPVVSTTGVQDLNITLLQSFSSSNLGVLIATQDQNGDISSWTSNTIPVTETMTGEIKISLSFDADVDLDLHVYSPGDEHLYFGTDELANGGVLDLDSNAGCSIDGINNENVTWPEGTAPAGEYRVVVDYYANCSVEEDVGYIVTVTIGNAVTTYSGVATAAEADGSWASTVQEVTTFTYGG